MWQKKKHSYLTHHGIEGQRWGIRRYQNEDGSLTAEGKERYSESLSGYYDNNDSDGDYTIKSGTSVFRRTSSDSDDDYGNSKYTYTYDYDNSADDNFYKQFGRKITEYTINDDITLAGRSTLGKAFVDKMLTLDNDDDIEAMDVLYSESRNRLGKDYVEDLFSYPYEPSKHVDDLERAGADMVAKMLATPRNDKFDAKMQRKGTRDPGTAANDIGRAIVDNLLSNGYSGMRDYNDYGSNANVNTPTVMFSPIETLIKRNSWLDDD